MSRTGKEISKSEVPTTGYGVKNRAPSPPFQDSLTCDQLFVVDPEESFYPLKPEVSSIIL